MSYTTFVSNNVLDFSKQIKAIRPSGKTYTISTVSVSDSTDNTEALTKGREVSLTEFMKYAVINAFVNI